MLRWLFALASVFVLASAGCRRAAADETPVATVRHFLEVMDRSAEEESALRDAFPLLDASARGELARRAERATNLSGHAYEAWQMLAQGRFRLRFVPAARGGLRERIDGEHAVVTVTGEQPGQKAEVPLTREQGHWRIRLDVPALRSEAASTGRTGR